MKNRFLIAALPLVIAACANPLTPAAEDPAAFNSLERPGIVFSGANEVIDHYLKGTGRDAPTTRSVNSDPKGEAKLVVVFSAEGYEDDSLAAEQWRVALAQTDIGYRVIEAGVRYRCYRAQPTEWRKAMCP